MNVNGSASENEKTVLLLPGLDAIFSSAKMRQWLHNPFVIDTLQEASKELSQITGQIEDIAGFIRAHKHLHLADFDRTLIALTSMQVAITRQLKVPWHITQGCSHGDIARSVVTGCISFREAIEFLWIFAQIRKQHSSGYTANIRMRDGSALPIEILGWLKNEGAPVSLWSENNATIGGSEKTLEKIISEAPTRGLKVKPVLEFPVHSPAMEPTMNLLREVTKNYTIRDPNAAVFSSVWVKFIRSGEEVREEALASAIQEVRWMDTLTHLYEIEGATQFINVGPSNILTSWLFNNPRFKNLKLVESWDLLNPSDNVDSSVN